MSFSLSLVIKSLFAAKKVKIKVEKKMDETYTKLSFDKLIKAAKSHSINYIIFPRNRTVLPDFTFDESYLLEGIFFGLCVKGNVQIKVNFEVHTLSPNSILVLLPGQIIRLFDRSDDFIIESMYVSLDLLINLPLPKNFVSLFNISKYPSLKVSEPEMQNLLEYYSFILKQYSRPDHDYKSNVLKGLLFSMIMNFLSVYKFNKTDEKYNPTTRQDEIVNNFFKLLKENYGHQRSVAFYADKLCITRKHLSTTVKNVTGQSVLAWIHEVFIIHAKVLLKNTNKSVLEISEDMNVSNPSFFCRLFKEHTGLSPLEYRNMTD